MPVRPVDIAEHFDAALPLMRANWEETGFAQFPFEPNRDAFVQMQALGFMVAVGAFVMDEMVGYAAATISPHPFSQQLLVASVNPLYVTPDYRDTHLGGRLMHAIREEAKARGAKLLFWHMRAGSAAAQMLVNHGLTPVDNVTMEEL